jgi:NADPH:quinone reductase-like Zn-dependent oxidoreductase
MFVIQLAALAGLEVIATASPQNFDLLKSFGAKYVFDYKSPTVIEDISKVTQGRLQYIFDCHATDGSTQQAVKCLSSAGGKVATLLFVDEASLGKNVEVVVPLLYKISGKAFPFGAKMLPASPEDKAWSEEWVVKMSKLLAEGKVRGNPVKIMGGLEAVPEGFKYMQEGKVRAQKLVYEVVKE